VPVEEMARDDGIEVLMSLFRNAVLVVKEHPNEPFGFQRNPNPSPVFLANGCNTTSPFLHPSSLREFDL